MLSAAYIYQITNLIVGILMVPLLLRYLNVNEYVLWAVFTTLGGVTLQLENAVQIVTVREIAREYYSGMTLAMRAALRKTKRAYNLLSLFVLTIVAGGGVYYLDVIAADKLEVTWGKEWVLFVCAYALNYFFGKNNSILLGTKNIAYFNYVNTFTRLLNLVLMYLLLNAGLSIFGLTISFAISVVIGVAFIAYKAQVSIRKYYLSKNRAENSFKQHDGSSKIFLYTMFTLASFILYKSGLLIVTGLFSGNIIGSYALSLQIYTMLSAFALVPIQVWLSRLVRAIASSDPKSVIREMVMTVAVVNVIFVAGTVSLIALGDALLFYIESKIALLGKFDLAVMGFAFLIEVNIFVLVNFLVTTRNYDFVKLYLLTSFTGYLLGLIMVWMTMNIVLSLLVIPMLIQLVVCVPMIFRIVCRELNTTPKLLYTQIGMSFYRT